MTATKMRLTIAALVRQRQHFSNVGADHRQLESFTYDPIKPNREYGVIP